MASPSPDNSVNFNIGVLGHVDSGKTALCRALSTTSSTASFDKNPQSQERGITLDLGFSSFSTPIPEHLRDGLSQSKTFIQYTLVDCPGHASLIRTILSGAQIMDLMFLVVDVTKGMQTQTAECLVIGEICCGKMIVVLNKIDLLPEDKRHQMILKMRTRIEKTLQTTKFAGAPLVAVAARINSLESAETQCLGMEDLLRTLSAATIIPHRDPTGSLLFSVDHCFTIRGQGTVMTGTVLAGTAKVNDPIEIVATKDTRKIKSMQMFRLPVQQAVQGDRVGICVPNFDAKLLERGFAAAPGTLHTIYGAVVCVSKIPYFKHPIRSRAKFHVTLGHETVMAKLQLFQSDKSIRPLELDYSEEYRHLEEVPESSDSCTAFALIELETPVVGQKGQLMIASKLDSDIHQNACRLAFHGRLIEAYLDRDYHSTQLFKLKIFKTKERSGVVERMQDRESVIVRNMVKKETDIGKFERLKVQLSTGEQGFIESAFGKSGKIKVRIPGGLKESTVVALTKPAKAKTANGDIDEDAGPRDATADASVILVKLEFKRFIHDSRKQMIQS
ncbi:Selenocysteine-specific elongation factor [Hypsibius exemplaris]|uniref:Selenocysteine-specific elongation factor n=1 Tax=Hypsibius exemplaris TaxID=2072580 RepID=A0A1W0WX65_HYPEX|nr:Selenocysteine-specific elongation factor [Hypsibius exemplaris]